MLPWVERLNAAFNGAGWTKAELSRRSGISYDNVHNYLRGNVAQPRGGGVDRLAKALGVNTLWLRDGVGPRAGAQSAEVRPLAQMPRDVPVLGTAAGAGVGAFQMDAGNVIDYARRPPGLAGAKDAYAIYVVGDSMSPRYEEGDPVFVHPHRPVLAGDYVVVQVKSRPSGEVEAYIKRLSRRTERWLYLDQLNPAGTTIKIAADTVVAVHKILWPKEIWGG